MVTRGNLTGLSYKGRYTFQFTKHYFDIYAFLNTFDGQLKKNDTTTSNIKMHINQQVGIAGNVGVYLLSKVSLYGTIGYPCVIEVFEEGRVLNDDETWNTLGMLLGLYIEFQII